MKLGISNLTVYDENCGYAAVATIGNISLARIFHIHVLPSKFYILKTESRTTDVCLRIYQNEKRHLLPSISRSFLAENSELINPIRTGVFRERVSLRGCYSPSFAVFSPLFVSQSIAIWHTVKNR